MYNMQLGLARKPVSYFVIIVRDRIKGLKLGHIDAYLGGAAVEEAPQ